MTDELDVMNWTTSKARDALASIFATGFRHAEEGRPYDYADEIIRRLHETGFVINPLVSDNEWMRRMHAAEAEVERLRELLTRIEHWSTTQHVIDLSREGLHPPEQNDA